MTNANCIVTVYNLEGDEDLKEKTVAQTGIRAILVPASQDVAVLHDVPVGQAFSLLINGQITSLSSDAKVVVTDSWISAVAVSDAYIVKGIVRVDAVMGNKLYSALVVKVSE